MSNDVTNSVLICGESGAGKSASLRNIRGQEGVIYINCEGGKPLPFKNKFQHIVIDDPKEIFGLIDKINADPKKRYHTIVIDTISFMMNRYESVHVIGSANTMTAWGDYGQFFPKLIYEYIAKSNAFVIMLGHLEAILDEASGKYKYNVPVKGALAKNGLEAYLTTVVVCKKLSIKDIEKDAEEGKLLKITERDRNLGYKHVFQTRTVKATVGDRIRSPFDLFKDEETYIDNDAQVLIDQIVGYYAD